MTEPSMATGVTAGVLAVIAALEATALPGMLLLGLLMSSGRPGADQPYRWTSFEWFALADGVCAVVLFVGAILLFARTRIGRNLTAVGGVLAVVTTLGQVFATVPNGGNAFGVLLVSSFGLVLAMMVAGLALAPSTADWIAARPR